MIITIDIKTNRQDDELIDKILGRIYTIDGVDDVKQLDGNVEYERGFIDGMQEQMRRSVDRAVNAMAASAEERNFCPRCGKRTANSSDIHIHTCTPPEKP